MTKLTHELGGSNSGVAATRSARWLLVCGCLSCVIYCVTLLISPQFAYDTQPIDRPLLAVLACFGVAFGIYLVSLWCAVRSQASRITPLVIGFAIAFRAIIVFSEPIQEIDIYRYAWDGVASSVGVSPFEYAPQEVLAARGQVDEPEELRTLVAASHASPAIRALLERVHFGHLPTVYPPVSQVVFSLAARSTPEQASATVRIRVMKLWLVLFDIGTVFVVLCLLRLAGRHPGWLVAYAWCPLVIKEFANSGHLDSIAVFFSSLAILLAVLAFFRDRRARDLGSRDHDSRNLSRDAETPHEGATQPFFDTRFAFACSACVCLGLAIGAKLYPVVLVPLLAASATRMGPAKTISLALVWLITTALCIAPMWSGGSTSHGERLASVAATPAEQFDVAKNPFDSPSIAIQDQDLASDVPPKLTPDLPTELAPNVPAPLPDAAHQATFEATPMDTDATPPDAISLPSRIGGRSEGLKAFLTQWMMNDFIFLNIAENITPDRFRNQSPTPWFVWVPNAVRENIVRSMRYGQPDETRVPFTVARTVTGLAFVLLAFCFAFQAARTTNVRDWCECVFLTMAWFWLLLPTLNPWYWVWSLPWLAFAKNRTWLLMSGLLFIYYLRFYFGAHFADRPVVTFWPYQGESFFDFVVVWFEYLPWFVCLFVTWFVRRKSATPRQLIPSAAS